MRLHSLEITAFGPFADTVTVDFDALSEASVFLLCGDTGAGKTTVLDAVCFGFYGDLPSSRSRAKQLRSHHAAPGVAPRVVLEASVAGRRVRFTRSPAWRRPKRRGSGTTLEQARVLVEELVEGTWLSRSNRLDEAGLLVGDLLGMTLAQFSQVVLLPQGQFDTFLRASSDERHTVLTQLFRTSRFEQVERCLTERRTALRRAGESHRESVTALLHRASESAGVPLPDWSGDLPTAADEDVPAAWISCLVQESNAALTSTQCALDLAAGALRDASDRLSAGSRLAELRARHARALARQQLLERSTAGGPQDRNALDRARRAASVVPLARLADEADAVAESRRGETRAAVLAVADLITETQVDEAALAERMREVTERAAVARSFLPRARALAQTEARLVSLETRVGDLKTRHDEVAARASAAPQRLITLQATLGGLRTSAARLPAARQRVSELGRLVSQLAIRAELEFQVADFSAKRDQQRSVTLSLREQLADLREQRLQGMAAELASAMAVGADCPVCGSLEHPTPARPSPDAPTKDDERELRIQVDTAEVTLETHVDQVRGYQARLDAVCLELGDRSQDQTLAELERAETALVTALQADRELAETEARLASAQQQERADSDLLSTLGAELRIATDHRAAARQAAETVSRELSELLGSAGDAEDLARLVQDSEHAAALLARAREALAEQGRTLQRAEQAHLAATQARAAAGFDDIVAACAAALPAEQVTALQQRVAARDRAAAEIEAVLGDADVDQAVQHPAPDLDALAGTRDTAAEAHTAAATAARVSVQRGDQLAGHVSTLRTALDNWAPLRAEHRLVASLAEFVEGKGSDNTRQMRLSAYVLASRLGHVVGAANERLRRMTDDRYTLEHTAERGVGERRGGLSLVVRDQWTDEPRDPVTLSGGEAFVVSLALALGLADVVTGEAGGEPIETLFVDEGFGSLDSDTLEQVMDTLDQLREGGRVVGLVSHVPELRTRISTQLVVHKTRTGSSLEQGLAPG